MFEKPRCEAYCSFSIFHLFQIMHLSICKDAVKANCLTNRESSKCAGREMDWIHFFMFLDKRNECLTDNALHFFSPFCRTKSIKNSCGSSLHQHKMSNHMKLWQPFMQNFPGQCHLSSLMYPKGGRWLHAKRLDWSLFFLNKNTLHSLSIAD